MDSIWTERARKQAEEPAAPTVTAVSPKPLNVCYACEMHFVPQTASHALIYCGT